MGFKKHLRTVQTIIFTLIVVIFFPVILRLLTDYQAGQVFHFGFENPILVIAIIFFIVLIPIANRIFNVQMSGEFHTANQIFGKYTSALAVKGATLGAAGLFSSIIYLLTSNFAVLVISIFSIILLVRTFPTQKGVMRNCRITEQDLENPKRNFYDDN